MIGLKDYVRKKINVRSSGQDPELLLYAERT
jgi:hypothetical protein